MGSLPVADDRNFQTASRIKGVLAVVQAGSGEDAKIEVNIVVGSEFPILRTLRNQRRIALVEPKFSIHPTAFVEIGL